LAERGIRLLRRHAPTGFRLGLVALSLLVIGYFALRTVFVPVVQFSRELLLLQTQSLTGVKGQTMLSPPRGLARIDFRLATEVEPGGWVRVKFELKPDPASPDAYGSGIIVFRDSRENWQVSLRFPPDLVPPGEEFYVRAEAILSGPGDRLYYWYARTDEYPHGNHHDLDEEIPGQDLFFTQYRVTNSPRPLGWIESIWARLAASASAAGNGSELALAIALAALSVSAVVVVAGSAYLVAARTKTSARATDITVALLVIIALGLALFMPGELPLANLDVPIQ
jgi:hypothetical protein